MPNTCRHPKSPCTDVSHFTRGSSVAIWSRVFDVSRPPFPYTQPGETTVESLGLSAPQEKGGTCRRKEGGEVGEFKQACLIDVSPFFRAGCVL